MAFRNGAARMILAGVIGVVAAEAQADPYGRVAGGRYGGGFIELLMTGNTPATPRGTLARANVLYDIPDDPGQSQPVPTRRRPESVTPAPVSVAPEPEFQRQTVAYRGPHGPGTIVIDTPSRFLYLVQPGGTAVRYGIGVGRPGFEWAGVKSVTAKREWPDWRPPAEMLKRRPDLPTFMAGGPENPLGARALYLGSSLYRIHGTNEPETIGKAVSSGCIRMLNDDVVDLYGRVKVGARVVVM